MSDLEARALALFDDYVDLPTPRRAAALARLAVEDPPLHEVLVRWLAADAADHPLEEMDFDDLLGLPGTGDKEDASGDVASSRVGNRLGPWRIDRLLGTGGMGTVYEASRADGQYEKRVALKCIRSEISSPSLIDAFMRERNHLAQLDHPHIAPLLDGGIESDGHPWFAMQLVQGTSIDLWADQQALTLTERTQLLLQACDALHYAHSRGVLHQDIKPGNVLVAQDGRVYLVDFGLSAVIDGGEGTASPRIAVSNGYAAPEILAGEASSVASEIYALGVMMYQLFVANWPRPLLPLHASFTRLPAIKAQPPSSLADAAWAGVATHRRCRDNAQLRKQLRGDLDAIALKCVALAPGDRYPSVAALITDLQHWLSRKPVVARKGGRLYVARRFVQRHAVASAIAAGTLVFVLTAASVFAWYHLRDQQEDRDMQAVSTLFEDTLGAATLSGLAETRPSSRQLLDQTEAHLRRLPLQSSPTLKARALVSLARSYAVLGDYPHALALADEANTLLADEPALRPDTQATLATLLNLQARYADARDVALAGLQQITASRHKADLTSLSLLTELARAHWGLSDHTAAFEALAFADTAADGLPAPLARTIRIDLLTLRGQWHAQLLNFRDAERDLRGAVALAGADLPAAADSAREALATLLAHEGHPQEALRIADALLASRRQRLGAAHPDTSRSLRLRLEIALMAAPMSVDAGALQRSHDAIAASFGTRHPEYARQRLLEARAPTTVDATQRIGLAREATTLFENTLGPRHEATLAAKEVLAGELLTASPPQVDDAIGLLQEIVQTARQRHWPAPTARLALAQALRLRAHVKAHDMPADDETAERLLQDALVEARRHLGADHFTTRQIRRALMKRPSARDSVETGDDVGAPQAPLP
ncbi:serine/threonine protein kinase [Pseudoxanthomonas sp. LjRoot125]|uniref:serine/threonine-protein kinase n=1 Tax=Pseudoxanthomonas sp. LjRoot125 TaxID=3342258 RepID=UPI003E11394E